MLQGRAFEGEGVRPYGAWLETLRALPRGDFADHLQTDLALLFPELGAAAVDGDRARLFEAVLQLLRGLGARSTPLLLLIDDLQWMDEASAALLHYIARAVEGDRILLACAARLGELAPARLLDGLERHGVLHASSASSYDFSHDVARAAAYARMSEPRRRVVHLQVARALWLSGGASGDTAGEVLRHAALAGEHEVAANACVAEGERCIRLFAYADARDLSRRGLEHPCISHPGSACPWRSSSWAFGRAGRAVTTLASRRASLWPRPCATFPLFSRSSAPGLSRYGESPCWR